MRNRLMLATLCAALFTAAFAPASRAASIDIGQIGLTNLTDTSGSLTASKTGAIITISNLGGDMITGGNFSLAANFNTLTNALTSGSFSLTGTLRDSSMTSLGTITLGGNFTGAIQNGNAVVFSFDTITPASPTPADTILDNAFGNKGIIQLAISGAVPAVFSLGSSFNATGTSTVDITAVPTPDAVSAGLLLLGGIAAFGARRSLKIS